MEHADAELYNGRQVILTPIERTLTAQLDKAQQVWTALGCHVKLMSPEAHDAAYAAVSHLPHLIAFALMNAIHDQKQGQEFLSLAGPGFRDFTRIAASDPSVWRDILMSNKEELLAQSKHFQRATCRPGGGHQRRQPGRAGSPDRHRQQHPCALAHVGHQAPGLTDPRRSRPRGVPTVFAGRSPAPRTLP